MEELDFQGLLDHFNSQGFQKSEQVILGHFGTVQTLLSLIFNLPVNVRDIEMDEEAGVIIRSVKLVVGDTVIGRAPSHIPREKNREDVLEDITSGRLGLGQVVVIQQIPNRRILGEVGKDKTAFWRTYTIEGPELFIEIHEHFYRKPLEEVGWLKPEQNAEG